ncbi:major facilitator superfamily domain-containing protein 6-like [Amphiura filiformis]|uniref:major facilitator superfamily domain-containing protein 6-like n=1 Tax=Amphiura filiformis TaxID=82378 RepID=UPI003B224EE9
MAETVDRDRLLNRYTETIQDLEKNLVQDKHAHPQPNGKPFENSTHPRQYGATHIDDDLQSLPEKQQCSCCMEKTTLKFKAFFFLFKGSKSCLVPFLPVFYQQCGIVASRIGILQSCSPFTQMPLMILITSLADRMNLRKSFIVMCLMCWVAGTWSLSMVPLPVSVSCSKALGQLQREYDPEVDPRSCLDNITNINSNISLASAESPRTAFVITEAFIPNERKVREESSSVPTRTKFAHLLEVFSNGPQTQDTTTNSESLAGYAYPEDEDYNTASSEVTGVAHFTFPFPTRSLENFNWLYDTKDLDRVFLIFLLLNIFGSVFQGPVHALSNAAVLDTLHSAGKMYEYGYQKAFGPAGAAIGTLAMGTYLSTTEITIERHGIEIQHTDYTAAFAVFAILMLMCIPLALLFEPTCKEKNHMFEWRVLCKVIFSTTYGSYFLAAVWTGIASGLSTSFLFWHIVALGGSHVIMGVAGLTALAVETVTYFMLPQLSLCFSYRIMMFFGLILVAVRYFVYGFVSNPWWLVLPECFKGVSAAVVEYILGAIFDDETLVQYSSSLQGSFMTAYYCLGFGLGSILGGVLMDALGAVHSFYLTAVLSLGVSLLFMLIKSIKNSYKTLQED